ncbi:MAG TPA: response regulator transcription factor [Miltoncostaeaceae bacterium]|nr:response regulator transcription factor [Miltoncostaeaceae bacterium]
MSASSRPSASPSRARGDDARRTGVLIVDDHAIVREGLRRVLGQREDLIVLGEASSGEEALEMVGRRRPDLVLMDARMPGMGGVAATQRLTAGHPEVRVIVFTAHSEQELLWEALDGGAQGFVLKDSESATLLEAIAQVGAGDPFVDPRLAPDFLRQFARPRPTSPLSAREREILQMLADGHSNREVSERLVVSVETVKTHVKHILAKLEAEHRTQAVAIGIRQSLIQ